MENDNVVVNEGTQSQQFDINPANGGELMIPDNQQEMYGQPSGLEMAASIGLTMAVGYGIGKLGELLWKKAIVPGYVKAVEWIDDKNREKDERIARKKAEKNRKEAEKAARKKEEEDAPEAEYTEVDSDENQNEQPLPKKGMKSVDAMHKKRKH